MKPVSYSSLRPLNSWDIAKIIALLLMFIDHAGIFYYTDQQWIRGIGRGAAPIFLFLAGFAASYRFKGDLLILAALMSISDFLLVGHLRPQNILFSILCWRLLFQWLERKGRVIERPYEWFVGSLACIASWFVVEYGTFGLLFAICGYMQRRPQLYAQPRQRRFMLVVFVTYAVFVAIFSEFSLASILCMAISLSGAYFLLSRLQLRDVPPGRLPGWLMRLLKWTSHYTGYIYAFHLIALEWLTGIPF